MCIRDSAGATIERAERADDVADVRVIDVAINDVGNDVIRMAARANLVSSSAHPRDVVRFEELRALRNAHALTRQHAIENWLNVRHDLKQISVASRVQSI